MFLSKFIFVFYSSNVNFALHVTEPERFILKEIYQPKMMYVTQYIHMRKQVAKLSLDIFSDVVNVNWY